MIRISLFYHYKKVFILDKEDFYSHEVMKILLLQVTHKQKNNCKDFETTNLGEYHDLYVENNTLLLPDVFENFTNMFLKIYELDTSKFLSDSGLVWQAALKKTKVKLDHLIDIDMLFMVD